MNTRHSDNTTNIESQLTSNPSKSSAHRTIVSVYLKETVVTTAPKMLCKDPESFVLKDGKKKAITAFTTQSCNNLRLIIYNTPCKWRTHITLTFQHGFAPQSGRILKRIIENTLGKLRYHFKGIKYAWKLEFQKNGAPHLHFVFSHDVGQILKKLWNHVPGSNKCSARKLDSDNDLEKLKLAKYFSKKDQTVVPKEFTDVGRFWGCSQGLLGKKTLLKLKIDGTSVYEKTLECLQTSTESRIEPRTGDLEQYEQEFHFFKVQESRASLGEKSLNTSGEIIQLRRINIDDPNKYYASAIVGDLLNNSSVIAARVNKQLPVAPKKDLALCLTGMSFEFLEDWEQSTPTKLTLDLVRTKEVCLDGKIRRKKGYPLDLEKETHQEEEPEERVSSYIWGLEERPEGEWLEEWLDNCKKETEKESADLEMENRFYSLKELCMQSMQSMQREDLKKLQEIFSRIEGLFYQKRQERESGTSLLMKCKNVSSLIGLTQRCVKDKGAGC